MPEPEGTETPGEKVRCPLCQTTYLKVLAKIDRIERVYGNALLNRMRARRGDTIYHCIYCRLQFYDARKPAGQAGKPVVKEQGAQPAAAEKTEPEPVKVLGQPPPERSAP
jgi:hypothetical protein